MQDFTIRPSTPEDDERLVEIHNAIFHDMPPVSVAEYRMWMRRGPLDKVIERYLAEADGHVVGVLDMVEEWQSRERGACLVFLQVDAPYRGRGIGSQLSECLMELARVNAVRRLYTWVREDMPESLRFGERRGFHQTGRVDRASLLEVRTARLDRAQEAEERVLRSGLRITTLQELGADEPVLRSILALENEASRDIPDSEERSDRDFDEWREVTIDAAGTSPAWIWLALDGDRPVGIARLRKRGERTMIHGLTAVAPAYRGRGIAKALKLQTVRWAREHGIDSLYTGNDAENHPMLAVNRELGYRALPAGLELLKNVDPAQPLT
jgi:GNAT superfamily N-acetyltransferase